MDRFLVTRRTFLKAVAVQPLLVDNLFIKHSPSPQQILHDVDAHDFIILNGWVLLKTDLFEPQG